MTINLKLDMDANKVYSRFQKRYELAQQRLDSEVLRTTGPYTPMRSGNLFRSGQDATKLGSGQVTWNTPYARRMYYGLNYNFSKDLHPQASAQWFEKSKAVNLPAWKQVVESTIKG